VGGGWWLVPSPAGRRIVGECGKWRENKFGSGSDNNIMAGMPRGDFT